jgi:hypothetical protein
LLASTRNSPKSDEARSPNLALRKVSLTEIVNQNKEDKVRLRLRNEGGMKVGGEQEGKWR